MAKPLTEEHGTNANSGRSQDCIGYSTLQADKFWPNRSWIPSTITIGTC